MEYEKYGEIESEIAKMDKVTEISTGSWIRRSLMEEVFEYSK